MAKKKNPPVKSLWVANTKKKKKPPVKSLEEVMESVDNRLNEIHSSDAVIANAEEKLEALGIDKHEEEAIAMANSGKAEKQPSPRKKQSKETKDDDLDEFGNFVEAQKRHGIHSKIQYASTSNIAGTKDIYMVGLTKDNDAFMFIYDHGHSAMMKFGPKSLEELKWQIDDVLVEMGLNSIGVRSENEHRWRSSQRRKD
jgi:hypothetical protein